MSQDVEDAIFAVLDRAHSRREDEAAEALAYLRSIADGGAVRCERDDREQWRVDRAHPEGGVMDRLWCVRYERGGKAFGLKSFSMARALIALAYSARAREAAK